MKRALLTTVALLGLSVGVAQAGGTSALDEYARTSSPVLADYAKSVEVSWWETAATIDLWVAEHTREGLVDDLDMLSIKIDRNRADEIVASMSPAGQAASGGDWQNHTVGTAVMVAASVPGLLTLTAALATLGWGLRRKRVELAAAFARAKVKARSAYAGGTASIRAMPLPVAIFLGMLAISAALYFHK